MRLPATGHGCVFVCVVHGGSRLTVVAVLRLHKYQIVTNLFGVLLR